MSFDTFFGVIVLIMSVVIHEVSHGMAALYLGDETAKLEGRLTLNPLKHLDPFGSVILPILLVVTHAGFVFGWAKPVPYNPYNLRNQKWGDAIVAAAGPVSNLILACVFGILVRVGIGYSLFSSTLVSIFASVVFINIVLAIFNLVPIPPLDGSKILFSFLPYYMRNVRIALERYGFFLVILFAFFLWNFISPIIDVVFRLITGISF